MQLAIQMKNKCEIIINSENNYKLNECNTNLNDISRMKIRRDYELTNKTFNSPRKYDECTRLQRESIKCFCIA